MTVTQISALNLNLFISSLPTHKPSDFSCRKSGKRGGPSGCDFRTSAVLHPSFVGLEQQERAEHVAQSTNWCRTRSTES